MVALSLHELAISEQPLPGPEALSMLLAFGLSDGLLFFEAKREKWQTLGTLIHPPRMALQEQYHPSNT